MLKCCIAIQTYIYLFVCRDGKSPDDSVIMMWMFGRWWRRLIVMYSYDTDTYLLG